MRSIGRVVRVALPAGGVIGFRIGLGQRIIVPVAINQIRVCDERNAERDRIGLAGLDSLAPALLVVTAISDDGPLVGGTDEVRDTCVFITNWKVGISGDFSSRKVQLWPPP